MSHGAAVWLPFVQPFGTVLLGVGAGLIAYRQWRTANNKVRLDLFDKQIANFNSLMHLLDSYRNGGGLDRGNREALSSVTLAAGLLFGDDMTSLFKEATRHIECAPMLVQDRTNSELFSEMAGKVDQLQFRMRDVLQTYAGLSRVR